MLRVVLLIAAIAAAGGAAWLSYRSFAAPQLSAAPGAPVAEPTVEILVAAEDIALGASVTAGQFAWRAWPERLADGAYILRRDRPHAPDELAAAIARGRFVTGEPVLASKLAMDASGLLAAMLEPGERAVAVSVSAESAAGGFVLPGDRVDVLLIETDTGANGRRSSSARTILRDVEVLAIDQTAEADEVDAVVAKTATLRLVEAEAEALVAAQATGELALALRAVSDRGAVTTTYDAYEPDAPAPEARAVVVRRGGVAETVEVR